MRCSIAPGIREAGNAEETHNPAASGVPVPCFGSVGRGTARYELDMDLLLVVRDLLRGGFNRVEEFLPVEAPLEPALKADDPGCPSITLSPIFRSRPGSGGPPAVGVSPWPAGRRPA